MTKTLTLVFLCGWFCGFAQTPDWVWARSAQSSAGPNGYGEGWSIATDPFENVFVSGYYGDTISFGSFTFISTNSSACVAKYDANGNIKWARSSSSSSLGFAYDWGVCCDVSGNCFETGLFRDTVSFGTITLAHATSGSGMFVVKYDSAGNVLWARNSGINDDAYGVSVATDNLGNVYVTGYFGSPTATFGAFTLSNLGAVNVFLVKYSASGNVLWAKSAGGIGDDFGNGVITDAYANVYITGSYGSSPAIFSSHSINNLGVINIFLAKYDSSGNVLWVTSAGGTYQDGSYGVAADSSSNIYITGIITSNPASFGTINLGNSPGGDPFLAKYDSSGNVLWARSGFGNSRDLAYSVCVSRNNRVYIAGSTNSPFMSFGTLIVTIPSTLDPMFVVAYDTSGNALYARILTSGGDDNNAVAVSPMGCVYTGGDYLSSPFIVGNDTLISSGGENIFVAKLCSIGLQISFAASATVFCSEPLQCIDFFDHSTGNPTSWQWHFTGAFPDTSSQQNPTNICYSTPGTYPVTLIVGNGTSSDTLTVANMIIVGGTPPLPVVSVVGGDTLVCSQAAHYQWYLNGNVIAGATDSIYVQHQNGTYSVQITDGYGCQAVSAGVDVGVDEMSGGGGVVVYPNPAGETLIIYSLARIPSPKERRVGALFEIYDVLGNDVSSFTPLLRRGDAGETFDVSALPDGIYFLKISSERLGTVNKKFVVMHK